MAAIHELCIVAGPADASWQHSAGAIKAALDEAVRDATLPLVVEIAPSARETRTRTCFIGHASDQEFMDAASRPQSHSWILVTGGAPRDEWSEKGLRYLTFSGFTESRASHFHRWIIAWSMRGFRQDELVDTAATLNTGLDDLSVLAAAALAELTPIALFCQLFDQFEEGLRTGQLQGDRQAMEDHVASAILDSAQNAREGLQRAAGQLLERSRSDDNGESPIQYLHADASANLWTAIDALPTADAEERTARLSAIARRVRDAEGTLAAIRNGDETGRSRFWEPAEYVYAAAYFLDREKDDARAGEFLAGADKRRRLHCSLRELRTAAFAISHQVRAERMIDGIPNDAAERREAIDEMIALAHLARTGAAWRRCSELRHDWLSNRIMPLMVYLEAIERGVRPASARLQQYAGKTSDLAATVQEFHTFLQRGCGVVMSAGLCELFDAALSAARLLEHWRREVVRAGDAAAHPPDIRTWIQPIRALFDSLQATPDELIADFDARLLDERTRRQARFAYDAFVRESFHH